MVARCTNLNTKIEKPRTIMFRLLRKERLNVGFGKRNRLTTDAAIRKVRVHDETGHCLNQSDVLVINILVPHAMREIVNTRPQGFLGIV